MLKRTVLIAGMFLVILSDVSLRAQSAQAPTQMPKRFEIYYEAGAGPSNSNSVGPGNFDAFDSEKKQRVFDARGGQVTYEAELTAGERAKIYNAISENKLFDVKHDFTNLRNRDVDPNMVGRLRFDVDGRIKEIRFKRAYGVVVTGDSEWTRFRNVLDVIESVLKAKDKKQDLPRHNVYE